MQRKGSKCLKSRQERIVSRLDIAVIGGGAAGIMAAISAAKRGGKVTIYERNDRIGKKILATGNGRCNLTNIDAKKENYYGKDTDFINNIESEFWTKETLDFFEEIGLVYKVEEKGKVFPYSDTAASVLDVLRFDLERRNVEIKYGFETENIKKQDDGFLITSYKGEKAKAKKVIITTGGKAAPASGSNGSGYRLLESFGHKTTNLFPSLVQIKLQEKDLKPLNGLKLSADVSVLVAGKAVKKENGEVLFTEYGLSGPAIFAVSRMVGANKNAVIEIDMMPEFGFNDLVDILKKHRAVMNSVDELFTGILHKRIGQVLIKNTVDIKMNDDIKKLSDMDIKKIAEKIKSYRVKTAGTMSWNNAQVTAGGIETKDFDPTTMESKLIKGIFAAGEILDIDGDCGGYNLQWAWSSGYIAGKNAVKG